MTQIKRDDIIICISNELNDFLENSSNITIGKSYKCLSVWNSQSDTYIGFMDDTNNYRNVNIKKFIKNTDNFYKQRFKVLLSR